LLPVPDANGTLAKGEFARLTNVTPGRVSQWIAERKIHGDALVGEGRHQRIHVETAKAQLRAQLDIGQRLGNGIDTRLAPAAPADPLATPPAQAPLPLADPLEEQIKREALKGRKLDNERKAEEAAARAGRYVDAEAARRQLGRQAAQMLAIFEGSLAELATSVAAQFKLPQRDVLHLLRGEFRTVRARIAALLAQRAADVPPLVAEEQTNDGEGEAAAEE
jgi:hypothetical protein